MNLSRIQRLVQLIGLLQVGKGHSASALAQICHVSKRTIFRDLEILRQAGVPVLLDEDQGSYRVPGTYYLPPTNFTYEEAMAVVVLCHEMGTKGRLPFYSPAQSAAMKLESSFPPALREQLRETTAAVEIQMPPNNPLEHQQTIYQSLLACITRRRMALVSYESFSEGQRLETRFSPYRLLFSRHSWYVIGRSIVHRDIRTFNLGRIVELQPLDEPFHMPRTFSVDQYLGNAWHLIPEPGPDHAVIIRFQKLVARNVAEVAWHKTQQIVELEDGSIDFHVRVSGLREISWWVLGYGDQAEVLQPQPLRDLVSERAQRMADNYRRDNGHGSVTTAKARKAK